MSTYAEVMALGSERDRLSDAVLSPVRANVRGAGVILTTGRYATGRPFARVSGSAGGYIYSLSVSPGGMVAYRVNGERFDGVDHVPSSRRVARAVFRAVSVETLEAYGEAYRAADVARLAWNAAGSPR